MFGFGRGKVVGETEHGVHGVRTEHARSMGGACTEHAEHRFLHVASTTRPPQDVGLFLDPFQIQ